MNEEVKKKLSRREFAARAAVISAAGSLASAGLAGGHLADQAGAAVAGQQADNLPKLSPAGQAEADGRYQQILSLYGERFSAEDKSLLRTLCIFLQPALERVRAYPLGNGDAPGLYLKPLVEGKKK